MPSDPAAPESVDPISSRGDQRRRAIIEAATAVFLEYGFSGTTLDKIIERSGGSRRTLYEQFGSKEGLFSAVLCQCCENVMSSVNITALYALHPREALRIIGDTYIRAIVDPTNLAIFRAAVADLGRFPEIGDVFYTNGPGFGYARLGEYLASKTAEGVLKVKDPEIGAVQFLGMVKSELHLRALFYPDYVPADAEIDRHVLGAVESFLAAYEA